MRKVQGALLLVLLLCAVPFAIHRHPPRTLDDFKVYLAAASLARQHAGPLLYDGADTGADPQFRFAEPGSAFDRAARALGVPRTRLYVYPPTLADLLIPLAALPVSTACALWLALESLFLLGSALLIRRILHVPWRSWGALAILAGVFLAIPTTLALFWGQVTPFLLLLWAGGIACYARGWRTGAGLLLALATAIKLTPLLVVLPVLVWRDWRFLRAFAGGAAAILLATTLLNGPATLVDFARHVVPAMSGGFAHAENSSISCAAQVVYLALHGASLAVLNRPVPHSVLLFAKALSALFLLLALVPVVRAGRNLSVSNRVLTLALFAMLTTPLSPVSWLHSYVVSYIGLAMLWAEALRRPVSNLWLLLMTLCSIELTTFVSRFLDIPAFSQSPHRLVMAALFCMMPAATLILVLGRLFQLPRATAVPSASPSS